MNMSMGPAGLSWAGMPRELSRQGHRDATPSGMVPTGEHAIQQQDRQLDDQLQALAARHMQFSPGAAGGRFNLQDALQAQDVSFANAIMHIVQQRIFLAKEAASLGLISNAMVILIKASVIIASAMDRLMQHLNGKDPPPEVAEAMDKLMQLQGRVVQTVKEILTRAGMPELSEEEIAGLLQQEPEQPGLPGFTGPPPGMAGGMAGGLNPGMGGSRPQPLDSKDMQKDMPGPKKADPKVKSGAKGRVNQRLAQLLAEVQALLMAAAQGTTVNMGLIHQALQKLDFLSVADKNGGLKRTGVLELAKAGEPVSGPNRAVINQLEALAEALASRRSPGSSGSRGSRPPQENTAQPPELQAFAAQLAGRSNPAVNGRLTGGPFGGMSGLF